MTMQIKLWLFATDNTGHFVGAKLCNKAPFHLLYLDSEDKEFPVKCGRQGCDFKYGVAEIGLETNITTKPMGA